MHDLVWLTIWVSNGEELKHALMKFDKKFMEITKPEEEQTIFEKSAQTVYQALYGVA